MALEFDLVLLPKAVGGTGIRSGVVIVYLTSVVDLIIFEFYPRAVTTVFCVLFAFDAFAL